MAQQTALQWLFEQINKGSITFEMTKKGVFIMQDYNIIEQAKQMEKEQIIQAHGKKINGGFRSNGDFFQEEITGEKYYNETYETT